MFCFLARPIQPIQMLSSNSFCFSFQQETTGKTVSADAINAWFMHENDNRHWGFVCANSLTFILNYVNDYFALWFQQRSFNNSYWPMLMILKTLTAASNVTCNFIHIFPFWLNYILFHLSLEKKMLKLENFKQISNHFAFDWN